MGKQWKQGVLMVRTNPSELDEKLDPTTDLLFFQC